MRNNKMKGFTLVELLVVIAILAILATVATVGYTAFIESATVSNDNSLAAQLNQFMVALKADSDGDFYDELQASGGKVTVDNVREITDYILNDSGLGTLVPQSAEYGYHFYFDLDAQEYVLIGDDDPRILGMSPLGRLFAGAISQSQTAYPESCFTEGGRYFLVETGTKLADVVALFKTVTDLESLNNLFTEVDGFRTNKGEQLKALVDFVKDSVFVTKDGTFVYDVTMAHKHLFIFPGATEIGNIKADFEGNLASDRVSATNPLITLDKDMTIVVPNGVKPVTNSLIIGGGKNVTIHIDAADWGVDANKVSELADKDFTSSDVTIKLNDGKEYVLVNGTHVYNKADVVDGAVVSGAEYVALLEAGTPVTDFDIILDSEYGKFVDDGYKTFEADGVTVKEVFDMLYTPYFKGSIDLGVKINNTYYSDGAMHWQVTEGSDVASVDANGKVTFKSLPANDKCLITVTATPVVGGDNPVTETIKLQIVRANEADITVEGVGQFLLATSSNFSGKLLHVAGADQYYTLSSNVTFNNATGDASLNDTCTVTYTVSGNSFKSPVGKDDEGNYRLELNVDGNGKITEDKNNVLTVTVTGSTGTKYFEQAITIDVIDNTVAAFTSKWNETFTSTNVVNGTTYTFDAPYRVGNTNAFSLGSIFQRNWSYTPDNTTVSIKNVITGQTLTSTSTLSANPSTLEVKYTSKIDDGDSWATTVQFAGTGVAEISIKVDGVVVASEVVEVVNGKNVVKSSDLSGGTNYVLLNNITSTGFSLTNATLYGNGFEIDITSANDKEHGIIYLYSSTLNGVRIRGAVYDTYGPYYQNTNHAAAVYSYSGNNVITNSYISGCASPVLQAASSLHIENTILYGGTYSNLEIGGGDVTLKNVVTFNQTNDNRGVVGLGIVISEVTENAHITIEGTLYQYNFISKNDAASVKHTYGQKLLDEIFTDKYAAYKFNDEFVNTGIISMNENIVLSNGADSALTDNRTNKQNYVCMAVSISELGFTFKGYACSPQPTTTDGVKENSYRDNYSEANRTQGALVPNFEFDLGNQEISYEGETDDRYCYYDNGVLKILYKQGSTPISLDLSTLATISKYTGQSFTSIIGGYTKKDGTVINIANNIVTFTEAGDYYVTFTITDNVMYDQNGNVSAATLEHTYKIPVTVEVIKADHKNAVISLTGNTLTSYINKTGYIFDYDYGFAAPVFNKLVIKDYDEAGNETTLDLMSYTTVTVTGEVHTGGTITLTYSGNRTLVITYTGTSSMGNNKNQRVLNAKKYNSTLYIITTGGTDSKSSVSGNITFTSYSFTGANGKTITLNEPVVNTFTSSLGEVKSSSFKSP